MDKKNQTEEKDQVDWFPFYRELAEKLLEYKKNRKELVQQVEHIFNANLANASINMSTKVEQCIDNLKDIDPFTVFALFNKDQDGGDRDTNCVKIIPSVADVFSIKAAIPKSLDKIPVVSHQNFVYCIDAIDTNDGKIECLWALFESALNYAEDESDNNKKVVSTFFNEAICIPKITVRNITTGLYWIAPSSFLCWNDKITSYINSSDKFPPDLKNPLNTSKDSRTCRAEEYFKIVDNFKVYLQSEDSDWKNFKELSDEAYDDKEVKTKNIAVEKAKFWRWCLIQALRDLDGTATYRDARGKIIENEGLPMEMIKEIKGEGKNKITIFNYDITNAAKNLISNEYICKIDGKKWELTDKGRGVNMDEIIDPDTFDEYEKKYKQKDTNAVSSDDNSKEPEGDSPAYDSEETSADVDTEEQKDFEVKKNEEDISNSVPKNPDGAVEGYTEKDFLQEVFMKESEYEALVHLLKTKKNVILEGPPGVGKTFTAKKLAYFITGAEDDSRIEIVQFHQSYSYEDFIGGYTAEREFRSGVFYNFCKKSETDGKNNYVFIIDEINRGNISKIFGEVLMLIEKVYRGTQVTLAGGERFSVPENLYLIGTRSTADQSPCDANCDLRRRFAFFEMRPNFETSKFDGYQKKLNSTDFNKLIDCVRELNSAVASDKFPGKELCIGHGYFCNLNPDTDIKQTLSEIVKYELIPLLKEYWFDEPGKVKNWSQKLQESAGVISLANRP